MGKNSSSFLRKNQGTTALNLLSTLKLNELQTNEFLASIKPLAVKVFGDLMASGSIFPPWNP